MHVIMVGFANCFKKKCIVRENVTSLETTHFTNMPNQGIHTVFSEALCQGPLTIGGQVVACVR